MASTCTGKSTCSAALPARVVVAVAAQHRDLPVGDELHRGRVQPGAGGGRVPRAQLAAPPPVPDPDEQQVALAHPDLLRLLRGDQVVGGHEVTRLQPGHPAQPRDVEQHAPADHPVLAPPRWSAPRLPSR